MSDYENQISKVVRSEAYKCGDRLRRGDIAKIIGTTNMSTSSRVLHLMTTGGQLEKVGREEYRRRSNSQYWLRRKWV